MVAITALISVLSIALIGQVNAQVPSEQVGVTDFRIRCDGNKESVATHAFFRANIGDANGYESDCFVAPRAFFGTEPHPLGDYHDLCTTFAYSTNNCQGDPIFSGLPTPGTKPDTCYPHGRALSAKIHCPAH